MHFDVLFENPDFLIINKPAGVACHGPDEAKTIVDLLKENELPTLLAHRLDKGTSGLLVVAKNTKTASELQVLFKERAIDKYYLAFSHKKGKKKQGTIKGNIAKARDGSYRMSEQGQKVMTQFFSYGFKENLRLFIIRPLTGRTHQIRVALKSNASPILGDNRYGGQTAERMYLHAYALRFTFKKEQHCFIAPFSEDFNDIFPVNASLLEHNLQEPWLLHWPKT